MNKPPVWFALAGLGLVTAWGSLYSPWLALLGVMAGVFVSAVTLVPLTLLARLLGAAMPSPKQGVTLTIVVAILKLPLLLVGLWYGTGLPGPGLACFLGSIGLVYCAFVWAIAREIGPA